MSRPVWHVRIEITLQNGQAGSVVMEAKDLITLREVRDQFNKALRMGETLQAEPQDTVPQNLRVVS